MWKVAEISVDASTLPVQIVHIGAEEKQYLSEVIALADQSRRTLGFLPQRVFEHAAGVGTLVVGVYDGRVAGYALYSLPRQVVRLTHLCVAESMRGRGVAWLLIDAIS